MSYVTIDLYCADEAVMRDMPSSAASLIEQIHLDPEKLLRNIRELREDKAALSALRGLPTGSTLEMVARLDPDENARFFTLVSKGLSAPIPQRLDAVMREFAALGREVEVDVEFEFRGEEPVEAPLNS